MSTRRAVVLIGSPRPKGESTSEALANYLGERLLERGVASSLFRAIAVYKKGATCELVEALSRADAFILASPVYVDSLPYPVVRVLEEIALHREHAPEQRPVQMLAIMNCGFPEVEHTQVALQICRNFARHAGFTWTGGLGLGGGEAIGGRRLQDVGWLARNVTRSLDLAAAALYAREALTDEAVELMATALVPARIYTAIASAGWYRRAWENGVMRQLRATPYALRAPR